MKSFISHRVQIALKKTIVIFMVVLLVLSVAEPLVASIFTNTGGHVIYYDDSDVVDPVFAEWEPEAYDEAMFPSADENQRMLDFTSGKGLAAGISAWSNQVGLPNGEISDEIMYTFGSEIIEKTDSVHDATFSIKEIDEYTDTEQESNWAIEDANDDVNGVNAQDIAIGSQNKELQNSNSDTEKQEKNVTESSAGNLDDTFSTWMT
ncbi:MAG: hypothetical protein FWH28_08430, partial [Clostridiales bacterium]|nr:hypothetical protein [Clostridiales bacterium]